MFARLLVASRFLAGLVLLALGLASIVGSGSGDSGSNTQVSITAQPSNQTAADGASTAFSVTASNATAYQWQRLVGTNWTDVPGAVSASYTLSAVYANNDQQVRVVVTGTGGAVTSSSVTLTVTPVAPAITIDPQPATVAQGLDASFTVGVTGTAPSYRWQISSNSGGSWTDIAGATNATLLVSTVGTADNGKQYRVVVSGPTGAPLTSRAAPLTVLGNVAITAQPTNQSAIDGANVTFTVAANNAGGYQWQRLNGATWADVPGATNASYSFVAGLASSGLQVRVVATGTGGPVTSSVATLTVTALIVAPGVTSQPLNTTVTAGQSATFSVTAGGSSPSYRWQQSGNAGASWSDVSAGTASALVLSNTVIGDSGKQYRVIVSNSAGSVTSSVASLTVVGPLAITQQPTGRTVVEGSTATFSVAATNAIGYQWQRLVNTTWNDVSGAAGPSLAFTAAMADNGAQFRVVVTGALGSTISSVAALTVTALIVAPTLTTQPGDQFVGAGRDAFFQVAATGPSLVYQWQYSNDSGANWTSFPSGGGATSYLLQSVAEADSGKQLRVVVSNGGGSVTSQPATVRVEFVLVADATACSTPGCAGDQDTGGAGSSGVGDGGGGSASAGPGLSAMRNVQVTVRKPSGQVLGQVQLCTAPLPTPCASYLVSLKPRGYAGPFIVEFADVGGGLYFDESARSWLPMQGQKLRVMVPTLTHHISTNPMTEAAYQMALQRVGSESAMSSALMSAVNAQLLAELNSKLAQTFHTNDLTNFVTPIDDRSGSGTLGNTVAGRYSAVMASLPIASSNFNSSLSAPALAFTHQVINDAKDDGLLNASVAVTNATYDSQLTQQLASGICTAISIWGSPTLPSQSRYGGVPGELTLLAGGVGGAGNCDGWGEYARFSFPGGLSIDGADRLYLADSFGRTIRRISPNRAVTTLAGVSSASGSAGGVGTAARFENAYGVASLPDGTTYVADYGSHTIRRVGSDRTVSTIAGLAGARGNVNGSLAASRFSTPTSLGVDATGAIYVADSGNSSIRRITASGVSLVAGGTWGFADGAGASAQFQSSFLHLVALPDGTLYVADSNTIRRVSPSGVVQTIAGVPNASGTSDGTGSAARFGSMAFLAIGPNGDIFVADQQNHTIRRVTPAGVVSTYAGLAGTMGSTDGAANQATFKQPSGLAFDSSGNLFVSEYGNNTIRMVSLSRVVSTFAGVAKILGSADGVQAQAQFFIPDGVAVDSNGTVYVAEYGNSTVRTVTSAGSVQTLAGLALATGTANGTGSAARFAYPEAIAVDAAGNAFVADTDNSVIRRVTPAGVVTTFAGIARSEGSNDGFRTSARFDRPRGVAVDAQGNLYVSDTKNRTIRKIIASTGMVITLAGTAGASGSADGAGAAAQFGGGTASIYYGPEHIAVDGNANVYVADIVNCTIRRVDPTGVVTTVAGSAGNCVLQDGDRSAARFRSPRSVAADRLGNLYVTDAATVRRVSIATGGVSTVVGRAGAVGNVLGPLPATLGSPLAVAVIADKQIVIASDNGLFLATFK